MDTPDTPDPATTAPAPSTAATAADYRKLRKSLVAAIRAAEAIEARDNAPAWALRCAATLRLCYSHAVSSVEEARAAATQPTLL